MDIEELERRLPAFCRAKYDVDEVGVFDVHAMPGHAGFAYGFSVELPAQRRTESWFLRLPPPNVNWRGTADVLRQVAVLNALDGTTVPHCSVQWSGDDLEWFGRPYFVVPQLEGDVIRLDEGEWALDLSADTLHDLGCQAMTALAAVHKVDPARASYLGEPVPFADDVVRWDRFYEKSADPERLARVPEVRRRLLETLPEDAPIGIFHGDFQMSNLFCSPRGDLLAVIDWELTGIGATLNDVGWICTFCDKDAWAKGEGARPTMLDPATLMGFYVDAYQAPLPDLNWFRALAAYKFAIISGLNLSLHRRGKRIDESWEQTALSMGPLIDRAMELLG